MTEATAPAAAASHAAAAGISPAVLFVIVIIAVIFFVSGLLHLLVRYLVRKTSRSAASLSARRFSSSGDAAGADALQRQLQQLFHLHDSGLDQAFIDALPVFLYREIIGPKEPFNCAVCLCEFATEDPLRLLPACGHAFHLQCIDTWLLSNSTCPLCRGALFLQGLPFENPIFDFFDENMEQEREPGCNNGDQEGSHRHAQEIVDDKRLYPVRLGKFRRIGNWKDNNAGNGGTSVSSALMRAENGDTSSRNLDARRCYSMGSYQYVVGDADLHVRLPHGSMRFGDAKTGRGKTLHTGSQVTGIEDGRRLDVATKGESFSVSKIWLWSNKKGKLPISSDTSSFDRNFPWLRRHEDP